MSDTEKKIYERLYKEVPEYNTYSPGASQFEFLNNVAYGCDVETILDAGCGKGQLINLFGDEGYDIRGCDITLIGLSPHIDRNLCTESELTALPYEDDQFDMVICVDVLEHLPGNELHKAISELARVTGRFAIIQVCMRGDGYGQRINEKLHKSVLTKDRWLLIFNKYFKSTRVLEDFNGDLLLFCRVQWEKE